MSVAHIRWMIRRDMPEILAIEAGTFHAPWGDEEYLALLRRRDHIGMVAEVGEAVVGLMVYELRPRSIILHRLVVRPSSLRLGIGTAMMNKLHNNLTPGRRNRLVVRCRETNLDGLHFLKAVGFVAVRLDREHYDDTGEDAIVMRRDCVAAPAAPSIVARRD